MQHKHRRDFNKVHAFRILQLTSFVFDEIPKKKKKKKKKTFKAMQQSTQQQQQQQQQPVRSDDPYAAIPDGPGNGLAAAMRLQQQPSGMLGAITIASCVTTVSQSSFFQYPDVPNGTIKPKRAAPVLANSGGQVRSSASFSSDNSLTYRSRIMVRLLLARPTALRCPAAAALVAVALAPRRPVAGSVGRLAAVLVRHLVVGSARRLAVGSARRLAVGSARRLAVASVRRPAPVRRRRVP
jgi:hypothetical protein